MTFGELREKVDIWAKLAKMDELEVLVQVDDAVLLPDIPNIDHDDNFYSIRSICIRFPEVKEGMK